MAPVMTQTEMLVEAGHLVARMGLRISDAQLTKVVANHYAKGHRYRSLREELLEFIGADGHHRRLSHKDPTAEQALGLTRRAV